MNNRLQKKCFIAATGFHLLLVGIALFGSAFFSSIESTNDQTNDRPPIDVISSDKLDAIMSPPASSANATPSAPPVVKPSQPQPVSVPHDLPLRERVRTEERVRTRTDKPAPRPESNSLTERAEAQRLETLAAAIRGASHAIANGVSGSTEVELPAGSWYHGPSEPDSTDFLNFVRKAYTDAWILPNSTSDDDATVSTSVTIGKDGKVVRYKLLKPSGNKSIDRSVQQALERVKEVVPLPAGSKESQRTVTIKFNARVKRAGG